MKEGGGRRRWIVMSATAAISLIELNRGGRESCMGFLVNYFSFH
jgi:hypothetical protein